MEKNYMVNDEYMEHCMEELFDIAHDDLESELQNFLDGEFNKATYLDILLTYDLLIGMCKDSYKEFFEKSKKEYLSQMPLELTKVALATILAKYNEYETPEECKYEDGREITHCNYCGKPILTDMDIRFISEDGSYCYEEIKEVNDIYHTCIGKELIKCGYSEKDIMTMLGPDYNEYKEAITSGEDFNSFNFTCENGDSMPEIFYTTAE